MKSNSEKKNLITTDLEATWVFDRPAIFLGEWCKKYNRKHIWEKMDVAVASPYGLGKAKRDSDFKELKSIDKQIFPGLCDTLNRTHNTQESYRYWKIILGHWLERYISLILNRVRTIEECIQEYTIESATAIQNENYSLATLTSNDFVWAANDSRWNCELYAKILKLLWSDKIPINYTSADSIEGFRITTGTTSESTLKTFLKALRQFFLTTYSRFSRANDVLFVASRLPLSVEFRLQLALGQVPQLRLLPSSSMTLPSPDRNLRRRLNDEFKRDNTTELFRTVASLLFELMPVCFLEGFGELSYRASRLGWPESPRKIFTSNSFDTDELFKVYAAQKTQSGSQYIVGQHGNNYGTHRYAYPSVEEATSDLFLTWGWQDGMYQHQPAFIFPNKYKKIKYDHHLGGLLLVEISRFHKTASYDVDAEYARYLNEQFQFVFGLANNIQEQITVRMKGQWRKTGGCEELRWEKSGLPVVLETGETPIARLIARNRIVVYSYDSTGMLESLAMNIPMIAFWQNGLEHLRDSSVPYYQLLVYAGIVHFTPESAADKVNAIWDDIPGWWHSKEVQYARKTFCDRYARISKTPLRDLKKILSY